MAKSSAEILELATQYSYMTTIKEAAKIRRQCTREEWDQVTFEARRLYIERRPLSRV